MNNYFICIRGGRNFVSSFLTYWLAAAKYNNQYTYPMDEFGSIRFMRETVFDNNIVNPTILYNDFIPPYFFQIDFRVQNTVEEILEKTSKVININLSITDKEEMTWLQLGKYTEYTGLPLADNEKKWFKNLKYALDKGFDDYNQNYQHVDNENVLNFTIDELIRGDADDLINKFAAFCDFPNENFNKNMLISWRQTVLSGKEAIIQFYNTLV